MNDNVKNTISNIIGLIMTAIAITLYTIHKIELSQFGIMLVVGLSLFLFKASRTKEWLAKLIEKKIK